jgi:G:T/U-mismatch repair DNA glycosylase
LPFRGYSWYFGIVARIRHRSADYVINPGTEILIIGTFNPATPENGADFFYGRRRNHLWRLLPAAFGMPSLKEKGREDKLRFMAARRVDFIDLVAEADLEDPSNYEDIFLDSRVTEWRDVIAEMKKLPGLKKACFTRKTLAGIPNIKKRVEALKEYCAKRGLPFRLLASPARCYLPGKQAEWSAFFGDGT